MSKRSRRSVLAPRTGVILGGIFVLLVLAKLTGERSPSPPERRSTPGVPILVGERRPSISSPLTPPPTPSPPPSPLPERAAERTPVPSLGVSLELPPGYRVAENLNRFDVEGGGPPRFTITKASREQEAEYQALLQGLADRQAATEAPAFAPGRTLTLQGTTSPATEESDAALARGREPVVAASGLAGTRYRRVEGVQTYDSTFFHLASGTRIAVHMVYSAEDLPFDEEGYRAVLQSLTPL